MRDSNVAGRAKRTSVSLELISGWHFIDSERFDLPLPGAGLPLINERQTEREGKVSR